MPAADGAPGSHLHHPDQNSFKVSIVKVGVKPVAVLRAGYQSEIFVPKRSL